MEVCQKLCLFFSLQLRSIKIFFLYKEIYIYFEPFIFT